MNVDELASPGLMPRVVSADPRRTVLPVRWTTEESVDDEVLGGGEADVTTAQDGDGADAQEVQPDAVGQGWVTPPGGERVDALFVLAGSSLGIGRTERIAAPVWLSLSDVVNLDAIGDPVDALTEVEIGMADGTVIGAGWSGDFCEAVIDALRADLERPASASAPPVTEPGSGVPDVRFDEVGPVVASVAPPTLPAEPDPSLDVAPTAPDTGIFSAQPVVRNRSRRAESSGTGTTTVGSASGGSTTEGNRVFPTTADTATPDAEEPMFGVGLVDQEPRSPDPLAGPPVDPPLDPPRGPTVDSPPEAARRPGALELEDVVYLGGYPGQTRRRKRCTAVLTDSGLEVAGPGDLRFRLAWDVVKTIEAQNSDEARFRMNTKIHGDSSALVVECEQGVTILLEARDCPTIPLRSAISQLLVGLPVLVV